MEDLGMGSVHALPPVPSSVGEADLVRGPACDRTLSPLVPARLLVPPVSTLLSSAPTIHHFVMDGLRACLAMHGSAGVRLLGRLRIY